MAIFKYLYTQNNCWNSLDLQFPNFWSQTFFIILKIIEDSKVPLSELNFIHWYLLEIKTEKNFEHLIIQLKMLYNKPITF